MPCPPPTQAVTIPYFLPSRFISFVNWIVNLHPVHPRLMGIGPVEAVPKVLKQAGMTLNDIDLVELNEAFASQALAVIRALEIDPSIVNINGGAIALGHPLGGTGTKLMTTLIHSLKARGKRYGLQTMCEGGGVANATIVEAL